MPIKKPIFADKNDAGFTLIELLVVVAISAVVTVTGFIYLGGYRSEQNLKLTASEILTTVKNTQANSASQQGGKKWGVRFVNTTSTAGQSYSVFSGTSFAAGTVSRTYSLGRNISFSNPWASSTLDTIFNAVTGYPSQPQVISMVSGRNDGMVNDIIMNSLGQITSKFDTGLVGYWHFDENTSSTAYDASGLGNNGTASGTTWISGTNCKAGSCLSFNGTSDYVDVGNRASLNVTTAITAEAWVYMTDSRDTEFIFGHGNTAFLGWWLGRDGGKLVFDIGTGVAYKQLNSGVTAALNQWYHVVGTWDGSTIKIYVDGALKNFDSISGTISYGATNKTFIGYLEGQSLARIFSGSIDEVRLYNRALTATEVADQYNALR